MIEDASHQFPGTSKRTEPTRAPLELIRQQGHSQVVTSSPCQGTNIHRPTWGGKTATSKFGYPLPHQVARRAIPSGEFYGSAVKWWAREDLNFRPHAYQARALTN